MTTRDYLWLSLVVGLCLCLFGRWSYHQEQRRWLEIRLAMTEAALQAVREESR